MLNQNSAQGSLFDVSTVLDYGQSIVNVAQELVKSLLQNRVLDPKTIQTQMNKHFFGSDAQGAWQWKDAYEALEVALILYLRYKGVKMLSQHPLSVLRQLEAVEALIPTHTRRSEQQVKLQQFSTPLPLAFIVAYAGRLRSDDLVVA